MPVSIDRFVRSIPTSTNVCVVESDLGNCFLKTLGNPEGPHALAAELIGSLLADWLGLPTLDFALIDIPALNNIQLASGAKALPGPAFVTRAVDQAFPWGGGEDSLALIGDKRVVAGLVMADTWTLNIDRYSPARVGDPASSTRINRDNVLMHQVGTGKSPLEVIAMDFTHAFTLGGELRKLHYIERIKSPNVFGMFPEFQKYVTRVNVLHYCKRLSEMTHVAVAALMQLVPTEWEVSNELRISWANFIVQRAQFMASAMEDILWPQQTIGGLIDEA